MAARRVHLLYGLAGSGKHSIGQEGNEHLASIMEPPSKAEGLNIVSD